MRRQKLLGTPDDAPERSHRVERSADATAALLSEADRLVREGRVVDAVDHLAAANREQRDPAIEVRLVDLRYDAARSFETGPGRSPWPPAYDDPFPDVVRRLPEIDGRDLSTNSIGGAVAHHGALIVRHLFDPEQVANGVDAIHRAEAHRHRTDHRTHDGSWYRPHPDPRGANTRGGVERRGGTWLADSPAGTALILDTLASAGVIDAIAGHLGERPFFSLQKSTLRHMLPIDKITGWHQDGSFLAPGVRTMNVWVALSPCGGDRPTPGLEVVPKRVEEILSTDGGLGPISIAPSLIDRVAADAPTVRPDFEPGDGLIFDERFVHRTYLHPNMTDDRYALECWLFAPSHNSSAEYVPFLV